MRAILGDLVFGVDDETMETRGARPAARPRAVRSALAESLTGGLVAARLTDVPGRQRRVPGFDRVATRPR